MLLRATQSLAYQHCQVLSMMKANQVSTKPMTVAPIRKVSKIEKITGNLKRVTSKRIMFLRLVLTVCLLVACSILTYFQFMKFINTHTTIATRVDKSNDKLSFPSIGFCPGMKREKVAELVWPLRIFDTSLKWTNESYEDSFNNTREGMNEIWNSYTYSADEIIDAINAEFQNIDFSSNEYNAYKARDLLDKKVGCLMLQEHGTPLGKCYSIHILCQVEPELGVQIKFNLTMVRKNKITVTLRHAKAAIGSTGYEPGMPVYIENLEGGSMTSVRLFTKKMVNAKGTNEVAEEEFYDCVNNAVYNKANEVSDNLCYHPSFELVLGQNLTQELEPCESEMAFYLANPTLMEAMMLPPRGPSCQEPKTYTTYGMRRQEFINGATQDDNIAQLFVYLANADILMEEDYNLQDFYAIIATLGGSIGIFFGWSFYDMAKLMTPITQQKRET